MSASHKKDSFLYLLFLLFCIAAPGIYFRFFNDHWTTLVLNVSSIFALFLLPVYFFKRHLRKYTWVLLPVFLLGTINIACIYFYKMPITDGIIIVAINTNKEEFMELAGGFILPFSLMAIFYLSLYFFCRKRVPEQIDNKTAARISLAALLTIVLLPFFDKAEYEYARKLRARFYTTFPTSFLYSVGVVYKQYQVMYAAVDEREKFTFNAKQSIHPKEEQIYMLVVGESDRRDHWNRFGYHRNTTPKINQQQNLIAFNNIHTSGYLTEFAVPILLTGVEPGNFMDHIKQKSIISAFKEAGFKTYWVSNQTDFGHISIHAAEADEQFHFLADRNKQIKNINDDIELLYPIKEILSRKEAKKLIIVKLQGSHYDYSKRYPASFDKFKPSNKTIKTAANDFTKKDIIINTYDNTVLYADFVLDSMIKILNSRNNLSALLYVSDHGEDLFDDERNLSQHAAPIPSRYIAPIPMFIWYSPHLKKLSAENIDWLVRNAEKKGTSANVFYTLSQLSGIQFPGFDSTRSFASGTYKEQPRLILGGDFKVFNSDSLQ